MDMKSTTPMLANDLLIIGELERGLEIVGMLHLTHNSH